MRRRRNPNVLERTVADTRVLYHPATDEVHVLDPVGSVVWDHLGCPQTAAELIVVLAAAFGEQPETIGGSVHRLLDQLEASGLVEGFSGASNPGSPG